MLTAGSDDGKLTVEFRRKYLRSDEVSALFTAAGKRGRHGFRDKALLRIIYRHGLRAREVRELRWTHIDLEHGNFEVRRVKNGNTAKHNLDRDELRDLRKLRTLSKGLYVFETERGGPLSTDALAYIIREAGKAASLGDRLHPHMLRHAACISLVNQGIDLNSI